ncbi:GNAT family N-acetyltransferase [Nocardiopsis flavescens]
MDDSHPRSVPPGLEPLPGLLHPPDGVLDDRDTAAEADLPALQEIAGRAGVAYRAGPGALIARTVHGAPAGWLAGVYDSVYTGPGAPCAPPHAYVRAVVVDPGARRLGFGTRLLSTFVARAHRLGVRWAFAAVDEGPGAEGRAAWFAERGWAPVDDPGEEWPVMCRWTDPDEHRQGRRAGGLS